MPIARSIRLRVTPLPAYLAAGAILVGGTRLEPEAG